ncbi:ATP-grasp domain-containing protein [Blastopirellula sp. JC732]|uniref:ATP-grasp domain-containing protein n=1 Tax=Blastopirellula sediminis TaxID=2894196 RepID=A0A9X1MLL3_9BACT|nr:ATP-grasp domain-containing protein [Blastopirellula sediminis]MCC9607616.1 ATP-grasp domain-containing protein [Blastopirellula sediminis]MCC9629091.1 ATP-grasp domain-containing protein [Blastopirellula sediminis]
MSPPPLPPRIAVVGCSCRAAVACLRRSGISAVAADQFADADLRRMAPATQLSRFPSDIPVWLADSDATHWIYVGGLENHPDVLAAAAQIRPLLGVPSPALPPIRDPLLLQQTLRSAGFLFPETVTAPPRAGRWLIKPRRSAGGLNIRRFTEPADNEEVVYQRFIPGRSYGAAFVAIDGQARFLGATRQLIGRKWGAPQPFQYAGSIGPIPLPDNVQETLQRLAEFLLASTQLQGLFGIDFVLHADQLWMLEINPRFTAAMELLPVDLMRLHLSAWLPEWRGENATPASSADQVRGKLFVYAPNDFVWSETLEQAIRDSNLAIADIPMPGSPMVRSGPILTLLSSGETPGAVASQLRHGRSQLRDRVALLR